MAVITATVTAIKAITTVAKVLAKKAATGGAKKFITNKAKKKVKEKVKGKVKDKFFGKKEKKGKGGALALRPSSAITTVGSTPLIPISNISKSIDSKLDKSSTDVKPTPKIAYDKLTQTIDNIVKITGDIRDASRTQLDSDKDILEEERKRRKEAATKRREALLESGKKVVGGVASGAAAVGGKFGIGNFFTNILIGGAIVAIIKAFKEIEKLFNDFKENAHLIFVTLKYGFGSFAQVAKALGGIVKNVGGKILGGFTGLVGKIGKAINTGVKTGLTRLGNVIFNFGKNAFNTVKNIANAVVNGISKGAEMAAKFLNSKTPQAIKSFFKGAKNFVDDASRFAITGAQKATSAVTSVAQKGTELAQTGITKVKGIINKLPIGKILKQKIGAAQQTGLFSGLKNVIKGLKVPIIGPLIVLVTGLLSGEPAGQATAKALGTMIGGLAGSPLGPIGMLVGELLGAEVGDLFYTAFLKGGEEGGIDAAKNQLKQKWESLLSGGKAALDWGAKGFNRLYESLPKVSLLFPVFGIKEILDPRSLLDPMGIARNIGKAFLSDDPITPGKLIDPQNDNNVTNMSEENAYDIQQGDRAGDFVTLPGGGLRVNTMSGTRALTPEEKALYDSGATNIDGSKPRAQTQPQERLMGGGVGKYSPLFDLIAAHEGNYNSINRGNAGDSPGGAAKYFGKNLTDMTVGEIMELQSQRKLHAAGKYQIVPGTMKDFVARGGVKKSDMFNSKTQEKFPEYVVNIKRPIVGKYFEGKASLEDAVINLAAEFASIGVPRDMKRGEFGSGYPKSDRPKGSTFYGGTSNRARTTPESVAAALQSIKGGATQEDQQSSEVKKVMKEQNMTKEEAERYISSDMESGPGPVDASYSGGSTSAQVDDSEKGETKLPEVNPQGGGGSGGESMTSEPEQAKLEPPPTGGGGGGGPSSSAQSVSKRASYEQGADQDLVIPLPQQQNGGGGMMRSKSRVMMMGGDSLDRYYKAQLLGALYKRG
tara:strand:+ start:904 stop:3879 length:2976 start_codon:yes stop_codon:yes gene_type:complete